MRRKTREKEPGAQYIGALARVPGAHRGAPGPQCGPKVRPDALVC